MRKIVVSESLSLDGVFEAETMGNGQLPLAVRSAMRSFEAKAGGERTSSLGVYEEAP